jgi:hypothetical protein
MKEPEMKIRAALFVLLLAAPAAATPRALPFTYPYETLPAGASELEQYVDIVPARVASERADGTLEGVLAHRYVLQTEFEYGITDRLEAAFYVVFRQAAAVGSGSLHFQGVKQRLRYRFANDYEFPVGVAGYLEVAEFNDEIELEEKLIVGRRFGRLQLLANAWFEQERYFQIKETKLIYNPAVGATWELSPSFIMGLEYWVRGRMGGSSTSTASADAPTRAHHYLGPTLLLQGKTMWFSLGAYLGLNALGRGFTVGEAYGPLWFRAMIGVDL